MTSRFLHCALSFSVACLSLWGNSALAGDTLVGDFRLAADAVVVQTAFEDPSFATRTAAPVVLDAGLPDVASAFSGLSQISDGTVEDQTASGAETDIRITTFAASTRIRNLNRYNVVNYRLPFQSGSLQWSFDLTPIDSYLTTNSLTLDALDLGLITTISGTGDYDILLSYTNPAESITKAGISTTVGASKPGSTANHANMWYPLHGAPYADFQQDGGDVDSDDLAVWQANYGSSVATGTITQGDANFDGEIDGADFLAWQRGFGPAPGPNPGEGDIFGGSYLVLGKDENLAAGSPTINESLLALYGAGVREFNLIIQSGGFIGGSRSISIDDGSGISITTSPAALSASTAAVPEPTALALAAISLIGLLQYRRK
jgi:hypothetical protein